VRIRGRGVSRAVNADTDRNSAIVFHISHAETMIPDDLRSTLIFVGDPLASRACEDD
jgi:hypothetical protein